MSTLKPVQHRVFPNGDRGGSSKSTGFSQGFQQDLWGGSIFSRKEVDPFGREGWCQRLYIKSCWICRQLLYDSVKPSTYCRKWYGLHQIFWTGKDELSNEKRAPGGCLGFILPNYVGTIVNHYKDPYEATSNYNGKRVFFFVGLTWIILLGSPNFGAPNVFWHSLWLLTLRLITPVISCESMQAGKQMLIPYTVRMDAYLTPKCDTLGEFIALKRLDGCFEDLAITWSECVCWLRKLWASKILPPSCHPRVSGKMEHCLLTCQGFWSTNLKSNMPIPGKTMHMQKLQSAVWRFIHEFEAKLLPMMNDGASKLHWLTTQMFWWTCFC